MIIRLVGLRIGDSYRIELSVPDEQSNRHELVFEKTVESSPIIEVAHHEDEVFDIPFD